MIRKYALFKVVDLLVNNSTEISLRGVAKKAGIGTATSKACLDYLKEKEIVKIKKIGNSHLFSLNPDNFVAKQVKILGILSAIKDSNLIQELLEEYSSVSSIILYGSSARGDYNEKSDIDLLIISRKPIKLKPLKVEKKISKEITFVIYTLSDWRKKAETDKPFYDGVIIDGIALYGEKPVVK